MNKPALLEVHNIVKNVVSGKVRQQILKKISYRFAKNEVYCIYGPSGAGKTTLLNIIGALDTPSQGTVSLSGKRISGNLERYRRTMGYLFQENNLIPEYTVLENIMLPLLVNGATSAVAKIRAENLLHEFALEKLSARNITDLSGGEKQRIALMRAVVHTPQVLICDEPTACLDSKNSKKIIDFIFQLKATYRLLVIIATHDKQIIKRADHTLHIFDGRLQVL